ncbi:MAG: phosphoglycerate dehydrogenase [Cyanobacteria bacterium NC_groundwater_1444_Ag_S-0.65um_54_12]|nr:phosphoglycerate dehydrogenase [Cyanobacteria bacterium NC_groundwater_1444_Ag_S-0.65um_54_12]
MPESLVRDFANVTRLGHDSAAFRVLACDSITPAGLAALLPLACIDIRPALLPEDLVACIADYDALLVRSATKVTAEALAAARCLKIVGRAGVGVDNIDVAAATRRGIVVVNSPEGNTIAAAEHTLGLLLALARHIPAADTAMKAGQWERDCFVGVELYHKTLGILGLGRIGQRVATLVRAFAMQVIGTDPYFAPERAQIQGIEWVDFATLLETSDFLTIHVPRTTETLNLFDRATLLRMKRGARLINAARGGIVDEVALAEVITAGHLAGAALDVFGKEPLGESVLRNLGSKVVLTPHLGASTQEAQLKVASDVAEQVKKVLTGQLTRGAVNIPAMQPELVGPVRNFLPLAEKLGALLGQIRGQAIRRIAITYAGKLAELATEPLTVAVLQGLLGNVMEGVNYVNAALLAQEHGIEVCETRTTELCEYSDLISITAARNSSDPLAACRTLAGTLLGEGNPRIVRIDDYRFNLEPSGHLLFITHQDVPGAVGRVGTMLGERSINIHGLQLGRQQLGGQALLAINVDEPIGTDLLDQLAAVPGFFDVKFVML